MPHPSFEQQALSPASAAFATRLFDALPDLRQHACMEGPDERGAFDLKVVLASPTGDAARDVYVWMERGEPSLAFGTWHTHASLWGGDGDRALVELLRAILTDRFVVSVDVDGKYPGFKDVLDLRDREALADRLTSQDAPSRLRLCSWGGSADAEVGLSDVKP